MQRIAPPDAWPSTTLRAARDNGLQPHRTGTFEVPLPTDPDFEAKVFDVVGLYLNPPDGAVVLSYDEKTQTQALARTQPLLPIDFDKSEKRTRDYVRHGITNLFAALEMHSGQVHADCFPRRRTVEFLAFLDRVWWPTRPTSRCTWLWTTCPPLRRRRRTRRDWRQDAQPCLLASTRDRLVADPCA